MWIGICRSYKNGYVWNDMTENDVVYASEGSEYVLKGSEIIPERDFSGQLSFWTVFILFIVICNPRIPLKLLYKVPFT